jgi:hypothetical protein
MNETELKEADKLDPQEAEELRLLYQVGIGDIAFFKKQQLAITNYAVLLYVALVAVSASLSGSDGLAEPLLLAIQVIISVFVVLSMLFGIKLLYSFQRSIAQARGRVRRSREQFSQRFWDAFQTRRGEEYESFFFAADLVMLQMNVLMVGGVLALVVIWLV